MSEAVSYQFSTGTGAEWAEARRFAHAAPYDTYSERREFALHLASTGFVDEVAAAAKRAADGGAVRIVGDYPKEHLIEVGGATPAQIRLSASGQEEYPDCGTGGRFNFEVVAVGTRGFVLGFFADLKRTYGEARLATVTWWYDSKDGARHRTVPLEPPLPMHDEFYPWLRGGVDAYLDRFLAAPASVLFLMGPPGTGKTSLMRHMIYQRHLAATITYDEKLLSTDELFVGFMTGSDDGVLIIEDADLLVGSRESEGNQLISRFLNVSDGLIKTSGKKIVFTTNQGDFRHVERGLDPRRAVF